MEPPILKEIDITINFNWGTDYIFNSLSDFISKRWISILSPVTALFTLTLSSDDGSRVLINNEVVLYKLIKGEFCN